MGKCTIEVIKKTANVDLQQEYGVQNICEGQDTSCDVFETGQTFAYENGDPVPDGFCGWAWADIKGDMEAICAGADFHWIKGEGTMISCCTDGLRPVVFKITKVD